MHSAVEIMLEKYECKNLDDYKNALKEIIQEITLLGLYRKGFFQKAAFYGGTALRIFYGLERFSEDLDFSLLKPDKNFVLSEYHQTIQDELGAYGFEMSIETRQKTQPTAIRSAFIKGGTQIHLLKIASVQPPLKGIHRDEKLSIKLEVDTDPPAGAEFEIKYHLNPVPFSVRLYKPPSLFAGKLHAMLFRGWQTRVKGRDFYDYIWYLKNNIPLNLEHLRRRAIQTSDIDPGSSFSFKELKSMIFNRFDTVDYKQMIKDIQPFISDPQSVEIWSAEFFKSITNDYLKSV